MIRIGDFARLGGVSVRTLRFYHQAGLLPARHINPSTGYRFYELSQFPSLHHIRTLQDFGFSLTSIRALLHADSSSRDLRELLLHQRNQLQRQLRDDCRRLERLEARLNDLSRAPMPSPLVVRDTRPAWVVSLRDKINSYGEADAMFREVERRTPCDLLTGERLTLWHACETDARTIECEAVRYLKSPARLPRGLKVYELPAATVASVLHTGGDATLSESYKTISRWLDSSTFRLHGPKREIYWREDDAKSQGQSLTEIQFPIVPKSGAKQRTGRAA